MKPPLPRHKAVFEAATQRIKQAASQAAQRCVDSLGLAALSSLKIRERDDFLAAQFELNRKLGSFSIAFDDTLERRIQQELAPASDSRRGAASTQWEALSLVDDHEVEATISADRFGLAIQHACEWELRELDAYMGSLLQLGRPDHDRNPLRPEVVGKALVLAVEAVSEQPPVRKLLAAEIGRSLASSMPAVYRSIVADLRSAGVQPVSLVLRSVEGPGNDLGRNTSGYDMLSRPAEFSAAEGGHAAPGYGAPGGWADAPGSGGTGAQTGAAGAARYSGGGHAVGAGGYPPGAQGGTGRSSSRSTGGALHTGSGAASRFAAAPVDAQLASLIRRLAAIGAAVPETAAPGGLGGEPSGAGGIGSAAAPMLPPNVIYAHREELHQASTGTLDHMVIDVVGSLFEHILSDPKVPPQMARQIARLQLPVLRVALGDASFFSSRRHPVRRFVNRIASLACAFEDLSAGPGQHFLGLVRELVQEIVSGDFDQMALYEHKLATLEDFIAEQSKAEIEAENVNAAELLETKERDLRVQQRYMRQLQAALGPVDMQDFLRDFLSQVWSQAIVQSTQRGAPGADELTQRLKRAGRELVMSVQPKGTPAERKQFLLQLPPLMKDLNDGLTLIGWPDSARKHFFGQLLPAHAESLKGQSMRQLDYNLLVRQLDAILGQPLPDAGEPQRLADGLPVLNDVVETLHFSAEEAEQIGLVRETAVDWDGTVDIDLSAEPELTEVDIHIDGLPAAESLEPSRGASLADHVQLGFAYQMHLEGQWQKVKLSYVSPGRAFFVFTRGRKHQKTLSMTARMLQRMCDTGRLRAFENAFLIERATARARKQLAALKGAPATTRQ